MKKRGTATTEEIAKDLSLTVGAAYSRLTTAAQLGCVDHVDAKTWKYLRGG